MQFFVLISACNCLLYLIFICSACDAVIVAMRFASAYENATLQLVFLVTCCLTFIRLNLRALALKQCYFWHFVTKNITSLIF